MMLALLFFAAVSATPAASPDPRALFAAERSAVGGSAWENVGAVRSSGTILQGGSPGTFESVIDHRSGYAKVSVVDGPTFDVSGYDGTSWDAQDGIVTQADLPSLQSDAVTQAYVTRDGWWSASDPASMTWLGRRKDGNLEADVVSVEPRGGSAVDVWFDPATHFIVRTVQHTDSGLVTSSYDDVRAVGAVRIPFHEVDVDPTGARTVIDVKQAVVDATLAPKELARPAPASRGTVDGGRSSVPFRLDDGATGHIILDATFNGKPAVVFFDSGGSNFLIPEAAQRLGIKTGGGTDVGGVGNGSVTASYGDAGTIAAGKAQLTGQHAIVAPLPFGAEHPSRELNVDGLIGFEFLSEFRTTVDYDARTIVFEPFGTSAPSGGVTVPFLSDGRHAYVEATIDGAKGLFGIDTGDGGGLTVFRRFADAQGIFAKGGLPYVAAGGVGGTVPYKLYRGHELQLAGAVIHAPVVEISDTESGAFASRSIAGNIGAEILDRFRLVFDYRARTITFTPNARIDEPFQSDRTGLSLTQTSQDAFIVLATVPGSPADEAGLKAGDAIVAIDGRSVAGDRLGFGDIATYKDSKAPEIEFTVRRGTTTLHAALHPRALLP